MAPSVSSRSVVRLRAETETISVVAIAVRISPVRKLAPPLGAGHDIPVGSDRPADLAALGRA